MRSFRTSKSTTTEANGAPPSGSAQSVAHTPGTAEATAAKPRLLAGLMNRKRRVEDATQLVDAQIRKGLGIASRGEVGGAGLPLDARAAFTNHTAAEQLIASLFPGLDLHNADHKAFVSSLLRVKPTVSGTAISPIYANGVLYAFALSIATEGNVSRAATVAKEWGNSGAKSPTPENREAAADLFETHCILAATNGGEAVLNAIGPSRWWPPATSPTQSDRLHELRATRWLTDGMQMHHESRPTSFDDVIRYLDQSEPLLAAPRAPTSRRKQAREAYAVALSRYSVHTTASQALRALHGGGPLTAADKTAIMAVRTGIDYAADQSAIDDTFEKLFVNYDRNPGFMKKMVSPGKAMPLANGNAQTAVFILNVLNQAETYLQVRFEDPQNTPADKARIAVAMATVSEYRAQAGKKGWYEAKEKQAAKAPASENAADPTPASDDAAPSRGIKNNVRHRIFMRHVRAKAAASLGIKKKAFRTDPQVRQAYETYRETLKEMDNVFDGEAFVKLLADDPLTEHAPSELSKAAKETYVSEAGRVLTLLDSQPSDGEAFVELVRTTPPGEKRVLHERAERRGIFAQWIHFGAPGHVPALWQVVEDAFTHRSPLEAMILSALAATATINMSRLTGGGGRVEVEANDAPENRHITIRGYETKQTENQVGIGTLFKGTLIGRGFSWLSGKFQFTHNTDGKKGFEWRFPARDGESFDELSTRVSEAMTQLFDRAPGVSATNVIASLDSDVLVSTASGKSTAVGTNVQVGTVGAVELTELPTWAGISRPLGRGDTRTTGQATGLANEYNVQLADSVTAGTAFAGQTVPRYWHQTLHGPLGESQKSDNVPSWVKRFTADQLPPSVQKLDKLVAKVVRNMGKRTLNMTVRIARDGTPVRIMQVDKKGLAKLQDRDSGKTHGLLPETPITLPPNTSTAIVTQELHPESRAAFSTWAMAKELLDARPASAAHLERVAQTTNNAFATMLAGGQDWAPPTVVEASATTSHKRTVNSNTAPYLVEGQTITGVDVTTTVQVLGAAESKAPPEKPQQSSNADG